MKDILDEVFDEGTWLAFSDRIMGLIDEEVDVELDEEIEAILISENFREVA